MGGSAVEDILVVFSNNPHDCSSFSNMRTERSTFIPFRPLAVRETPLEVVAASLPLPGQSRLPVLFARVTSPRQLVHTSARRSFQVLHLLHGHHPGLGVFELPFSCAAAGSNLTLAEDSAGFAELGVFSRGVSDP